MKNFVKVPVPGRRYVFVARAQIQMVEPVFKLDPALGANVEADECYLHFLGEDGRMRIEISATQFLARIDG